MVCFRPVFPTDDDYYLSMIPAGIGIASAPSSDLILSSRLIGVVLKTLCGWFPETSIYSLYLVISLMLANWALLFIWLDKDFKKAKFLLGILFLLGGPANFFQMLQFTTCSNWVGFAGFMVWIHRARFPSPRTFYINWVTIALLSLCFLIRRQSFYMLSLIWLPVLAVSVMDLKARMQAVLPTVAALTAVLLALIVAEKAVEISDSRVMANRALLPEIIAIADFNAYPENQDLLRSSLAAGGLSLNDFNLIKNYFWADDSVYSPSAFKALAATGQFKVFPFLHSTLDQALGFPRLWFRGSEMRMTLMFALLFPFLLSFTRMGIYGALMGSLSSLGLLIFLASCNRLPPRIFETILCGIPALLLTLGAFRFRSLRLLMGVVLALTLIIGKYLYGMHGKYLPMIELSTRVERVMEKFFPNPDDLYVVWMAPLPPNGVQALSNLKRLLKGMNIVALSWPQRTSVYYAQLDRFGITQLIPALYEHDHVYLVTLPHLLPFLGEFIHEHYGKTVHFNKQFQSDMMTTYRVETITP